MLLLCTLLTLGICSSLPAQESSEPRIDPNAEMMVHSTMARLALNDAFDAKLRQRIWACGRAVVGVGHYEQSGGGSGRFSLEMTIHDGDSRQTMKQISDGKLCWHRVQIGEAISVHRVDIGRIDEYERELLGGQSMTEFSLPNASPHRFARHSLIQAPDRLPSRLAVGGLIELLDRIASDYNLRLGKGTVERQPVWVLRGTLREAVRGRIELASGREQWAALCPVEVRVAIAATADANGFGVGLPLRIEFFSAPQATPTLAASESAPSTDTSESSTANESTKTKTPLIDAPAGPLISLLEIYAMRKIEQSPEERFRFVSDDREVTFNNDTRRYLDRIGK